METKMEKKFTPGPWRFDPYNYGRCFSNGFGLIDSENGSLGVHVSCYDINDKPIKACEANARLIALAPEMLDIIFREIESGRNFGGDGDQYEKAIEVLKQVGMYDTALSKSTGGAA